MYSDKDIDRILDVADIYDVAKEFSHAQTGQSQLCMLLSGAQRADTIVHHYSIQKHVSLFWLWDLRQCDILFNKGTGYDIPGSHQMAFKPLRDRGRGGQTGVGTGSSGTDKARYHEGCYC